MNNKCGCCEGSEYLTPISTANRPGLPALIYRAGTHGTFFETMKARLTGLCLGTEEECKAGQGTYPLAELTTRESSDPSIALLDAWATIGDVLTFYQERVANEGYLRTATQRRSILELARLVGYKPRPGVSASVHLAFTLDDNAGEIIIPRGTGAKSIPGQGETTQTFETSEDLKARPEWNELKPRMSRPQKLNRNTERIYFEGTATNLKTNDLLLIDSGGEAPLTRFVESVAPDFAAKRTTVTLQADPFSTVLFRRQATAELTAYRTLTAPIPSDSRPDSDAAIKTALKQLEDNLKPDATDPTLVGMDRATQTAIVALRLILDTTLANSVKGFNELAKALDEISVDSDPSDNSRLELKFTQIDTLIRTNTISVVTAPLVKNLFEILKETFKALNQLSSALNPSMTMPTLKGEVTRTVDTGRNTVAADATRSLKALSASAHTQGGTQLSVAINTLVTAFEALVTATPGSGTESEKKAFIANARAEANNLIPGPLKTSLDQLLQAITVATTIGNLQEVVRITIEDGRNPGTVNESKSLNAIRADARRVGADRIVAQISALITGLQGIPGTGTVAEFQDAVVAGVAEHSPTAIGEAAIVESIDQLDDVAGINTAIPIPNLDVAAQYLDIYHHDIQVFVGNTNVALQFKAVTDALQAIVDESDKSKTGTLAELIKDNVPAEAPATSDDELKGNVPLIRSPLLALVPDTPLPLSRLISESRRTAIAISSLNDSIRNLQGIFNLHKDSLDRLVKGLESLVMRVRGVFASEVDGIRKRHSFLDSFAGSAAAFAKQAFAVINTLAEAAVFKDLLTNSLGKFVDVVNDHVGRSLVPVDPNLQKILNEVVAQGAAMAVLATRLSTLIRELAELNSRVTVKDDTEQPPLPPPALAFQRLLGLRSSLALRQANQPRGRAELTRELSEIFNLESDVLPQLLQVFEPEISSDLYQAWRNSKVELPSPKVYIMRARAAVFGYNAPPDITVTRDSVNKSEWTPAADEAKDRLYLDNQYSGVIPGGFVAIQIPNRSQPIAFAVADVLLQPRTEYGISGKSTDITIQTDPENPGWWKPAKGAEPGDGFDYVRGTTVYAESELLPLAEEPIVRQPGEPNTTSEVDEAANEIELDSLYDGLDVGRSFFISGERLHLRGVTSTERAVLAGVKQVLRSDLPGDTPHTRLVFANDLTFSYKRETTRLFANVVVATHGETKADVLGSGDAAQSFQIFALSNNPLTHLPAATPTGSVSTLSVRVNGIKWRETEDFAAHAPTDRIFVTSTDNEHQTSVTFGNGMSSARVPTGVENVTAEYRTGIGQAGNVHAKQISQLAEKPLGVKAVDNPQRASGGADPESRDQIRENAPLAVIALDRLVSVQDYSDLARTFAGIGKAVARRLTDGRSQLIQMTVAGSNDIPIDPASELFRNLEQLLISSGTCSTSIKLATRELSLLIIDAGVRVLPDYLWQNVEIDIRRALLREFSFDRRNLGQDVTLSEIISTMQRVPGVAFVDVNVLHAVNESITNDQLDKLAETLKTKSDQPRKRISVGVAGSKIHMVENDNENISDIAPLYHPRSSLDELLRLNPGILADAPLKKGQSILVSRTWPAQIAYLSPNVPDTLILSEIR